METVSQALSGEKLLDTLLFDTNFVGIFLWDFDGRVLQANDAFLRIVGYEREDLVAGRMRWTDITPPDLQDRQAERVREHRRTGRLQPFEKEYFRKDGTRVPVLVGVATFGEGGNQGVGFVLDLTERKRAEDERRAHVWFLESMDRLNRAMQGTQDLQQMLDDILHATLDIFACDRAWLIYPCDPDAASWHAVMEHTRPQFPGAFALQAELPVDGDVAAVFAAARAAPGAVLFGPDYDLKIPALAADRFAVRSQMAMAIDAKADKPYLFGLHQCSRARIWTAEEQRLFQEIGRRLSDAISALSTLRSLRDSERKLDAAQRIAHVGWWERDFGTNRVALSEEVQRIFGVRPVDLPHWQDRWTDLIHPQDRARTAEAAAAAERGGPRYDVEYRVVRPDGTVRVVHSQGDVVRDDAGRPLRQFGVLQDITELRQSEDELSEVKERFRVLAESSLTGIYLTEQDRFTYVNPALAKMFGYEVEEVVGRLGTTDLTCPDDRSLVAENMRRRLQGDVEEMRYEFRGLRKDGSVFPVEVHGRRIEHGGRIGVLGTLIDNTERKRAEDELRESEARFRKLTDLSSDWYWRQDENLRFTQTADEKAGYSMPVSLGKTRWELPVTPLSASWDEHRAVLAARQPFRDFQYSRIDPEGGTHYISVSGVPVFDERGAFKGYDGVASDITPRKRAEQALRASEARFRTFVDHATDAFFLLDEQLVVVDVNRQACASLGWSREELIGMHPREFDVGLDEPSIKGLAQRAGAGEIVTFETRHLRKDGTAFPVEIRSATFKQGRDLFYLALARDISERKLAEESLRQSEAYLAEAQRLSHTGSWALDVASGRYVYTSEESDRIFGFDPQVETPTRDAVFKRIHPEDQSSWKRNLEKSLREKVDTFDQYRIVLPDGSVRHIHTIRHPVVNSAGEVVKLVGTSIDITERKRAEEEHERLRRLEAELAHANRVNMLGELTTSIAHEVSQPLGAMVASAGACARWLAANPPAMAEARSALDNVVVDGKRAREVIGRIRALTKQQMPRMDLLDLNRKILEVLAFTERELRSHDIALETRLDSTLPQVTGDRVQLQQVLLNLIVNAIEAMSGVHDRPRELTIVSRPDGSNAVVVEVRDSGAGLEPGRAEQVFEAFYTTKAEGLGIGLSISRSIVETHGGRLSASANQPYGAVFRFSLPIAEVRQS